MKKTTTKLQLKKDTIRVLQDNELQTVQGGATTNTCTGAATGCSGPHHSDHCHTWKC